LLPATIQILRPFASLRSQSIRAPAPLC
jgi:hypothetical protein